MKYDELRGTVVSGLGRASLNFYYLSFVSFRKRASKIKQKN